MAKRLELFTGADITLFIELVANLRKDDYADKDEVLALIYRCRYIATSVEAGVDVRIKLNTRA